MFFHRLPNFLSFLRIFLSLPVFFLSKRGEFCAASFLILLGTTTDFLDGLLARRFGAESRFGTLLDPLADKLFFLSVLVSSLFLPYRPPLFLYGAFFLKEAPVLVGSIFLLKKGTLPTPNLLGKTAVANLFVYLSFLFFSACFEFFEKLKSVLSLWGYLSGFLLLLSAAVYAAAFLKIRKERWERG